MSQNRKNLLVGLMSGTSLDAMDAVLIEYSKKKQVKRIGFTSVKISQQLKTLILKNSLPETSQVDEISYLNIAIAKLAARAVKKLIKKTRKTERQISAIGFHGQTIFHQPVKNNLAGLSLRSTLQLGDAPTLASLTGIPVVNNFRTKDMILGGEGAPLAPFGHQILFRDLIKKKGIVIHNIGGISNLTYLSKNKIMAFDTGPGNMLIDNLMLKLFGKPFDRNGQLALKGKVSENIVKHFLNQDLFFSKRPPKSTGREVYGEEYTERFLAFCKKQKILPMDIIATASELSLQSMLKGYQQLKKFSYAKIILCGGGAYNSYFQRGLKTHLQVALSLSDEFGFGVQEIEATCFAILAYYGLTKKPVDLGLFTGSKIPQKIGQISYS